LRYKIGTNLEYARIHEFGGTINHPGGTFYIGPNGAVFLGADKAATGPPARGFVCGPHPPAHEFKCPAPVFVPTLKRMTADGTLQRRF
jgi:hypothetical protein